MQKDESISQIESGVNQRVGIRKMKESFGLVAEPLGHNYGKLKSNIFEQMWNWLTTHKGYRFVLFAFVLTFSIVFAYFHYPQFLLVIISSPVILMMDALFAYKAAQKKKKKIYDFQINRKTVPIGMTVSDDGTEVNPVAFECDITGHHVWSLNEDAISDNPRADAVQLYSFHTSRDYVTNREEYFTEYISPDGYFAAGQPFTGDSNYSLLTMYQHPKTWINPKFKKIMEELEKTPKTSFEDVEHAKELEKEMMDKIHEATDKADEISALLKSNGFHIKEVGKLSFATERFFVNYTNWKDIQFKDYMAWKKTPESVTLPSAIYKLNNESISTYMRDSVQLQLHDIEDRMRISLRDAKRKLTTQSLDEMNAIVKKEEDKLEAPAPASVTKEYIHDQQEIVDDTEEEDDDKW